MTLSEKDQTYIWHPFTPLKNAKQNIVIVAGKQALLWDDTGKEYIDAVSSWWTNIFGHTQPQIVKAVKNQLSKLEHVIFAGFTHVPAINTAERLLSILPKHQTKVFFSDNGSTSVEVALKMAIQYWHNKGMQKNNIVAFKNAYHGDTFGAMSVGARGCFNQPFEHLLFNTTFIDLPTKENFETLKVEFQQLLQKNDVAAFIFEPLVQGSAGMLMYDACFLDTLIEMAQKHNVLCIADEVMTGFGRTGKLFATDYIQHKPDIYCLSKGITGGFLPLGITTCTQQIVNGFISDDKFKTFYHGHSYTANPLACAAAAASLQLLIQKQQYIFRLTELQKTFANQLKSNKKIENLRQQGTIVAFDVKTNSKSGYFNDKRDFLYDNFIKRGVILRPLGNTIYIMPPYVITKKQLQKVYTVINEVLEMVE